MERTITVFKLPADGSLRAIPEEIPDKLEVLQQYVAGNIEIVTLSRELDGSSLIMIVNDCGLIEGLPVNPIATMATMVYKSCFNAKAAIRGNAIVCTANAEGELQDISPYQGLHLMIFAKQMQNEVGGEKLT